MDIVWSPTGGECRRFVFTPAKLRTVDAEAVEGVGGATWQDFDTFSRLFNRGNRRALRAALWLCLRREDPSIRFEGLDVGVYDISVEFGEDERETARRILTETEDLDEDQRTFWVAVLGEDIGAADPKDDEPQSDSQPPTTP